jgi:PAS domain S-box-containing protein
MSLSLNPAEGSATAVHKKDGLCLSAVLSVLIVEDSEDDAFFVAETLRHAGYELTFARVETPEAMKAALDRQPWDIVIADHRLPLFSAPCALALIKERGLDVPFIIISGHIDERVAIACMQAGAHDYLLKDNLARLVPVIRRELQEAGVRILRRQADEQLRLRITILECQSEAAIDGILVVSNDKQWLSHNSRFVQMWGIPPEIVQARCTEAAFAAIMDRMADPEPFRQSLQRLEDYRDNEIRDEIALHDGRIFDSYSRPVKTSDGIYYGRVWYCRDVTQRNRAEKRLAAQHAVTRILVDSATINDATPKIVHALCESLGWELGALWSVDRSAEQLRLVEVWHSLGAAGAEFKTGLEQFTFSVGTGLPGRVWSSRRPAWLPNVAQDNDFPPSLMAASLGLHGAFAFPIQLGSEFLGVIEFFSRKIEPPDDDLLDMFTTISLQIGQFIERRRIEEALRESEARNRAILESSLDGIITIDHDGRVIKFNPAAEEAFGLVHADAAGKRLAELVNFPIAHTDRRGIGDYLAKSEGKRVELSARRSDGSQFPVELALARIAVDGATVFIGYIRDITLRKRAEEALQRANETMKSILGSFPDVICVINLEREILFSNPAADQLFAELGLHHCLPMEISRMVDHVLELGTDHLPVNFDKTYRTQIHDEDKFYLPRLVVMHTRAGLPFGVVIFLQDVTAFRLLDDVKTNLIATVSHELKTPMTSLRMALLVMIEETLGSLNERQKEMMGIAHNESERLLRMLNALLDLARFEEGLAGISLQQVAPAELVQAALAETSAGALRKDLIMTAELAADLPLLHLDRFRMTHVFTNLLTNAIKHSPHGGTIVFRVVKREGNVSRFSVIDQGPGVPVQYQDQIFERFFRISGQDKTGAGLGLAIAKEFVKAHRGTIGVISAGPGSEFYVDLPAAV